jgi:hypothetical protein
MVAGMTKSGKVLGLALAAAVLFAVASAEAASGKKLVVVELYTSQGCSSCVPADSLLGRLADRKDVLAFSLPITYWDMMGWKDTLASEMNTRRQMAYAQAMGHGGVYTPQMIVDGASDVIGSREAAVEAAIAAHENDADTAPVTLRVTKQEIHVSVGAGSPRDASQDATIWLLRIQDKAIVSIGSGENQGRTITYRNVVRDMKSIGIWKGQPIAVDLPRQDVTGAPSDTVAVIVQQNGYGHVLGAAMLDRTDFSDAR